MITARYIAADQICYGDEVTEGAATGARGHDGRIDVDFSLALHNRTGKYFIGRDIIADQAPLIGSVYYWRARASAVPGGIAAKLLGRALAVEQRLHARGPHRTLRRFRPRRPLLHLDPYTVCHARLRADDIVLCHDLGPVTHPALFEPAVAALYRRAYAEIAAARPLMIFVSQSSRAAFASRYGEAARARTIYPPIRSEFAGGARQAVAGLPDRYLLTVGSMGRRKNQARAIAAFVQSGLADEGVGYVICGSREPGADAVIAAAAQAGAVRLLSYVSDAELNWLYAHAAGFVLTSLLEGFGVPVAEAIAHDLVPIVTRGGVLHEVAGEGALLVDPDDTAEIAAAMRRLVFMSDDERDRRRVALRAAVTRFSRDAFRQAWRTALTEEAAAG